MAQRADKKGTKTSSFLLSRKSNAPALGTEEEYLGSSRTYYTRMEKLPENTLANPSKSDIMGQDRNKRASAKRMPAVTEGRRMNREPIRVAVMADTHGVLRPEVEQVLATCDVVIHAGDFDNQLLYHKLSVEWPLYAVCGNNDRGAWAGGLPTVKRFSIGGVRFIMAHKRQDVPSSLGDAQVVIFGHSHMYQQEEVAGRLWLNPGGCGFKRFTLPLSLAVMTIADGTWTLDTIWLEKGYGTRSAAIAQREKAKESRYEKRQKRYRQSRAAVSEKKGPATDGDGEFGGADALVGAVSPVRAEEASRPAFPEPGRDELFLIARILRQHKTGGEPAWIAENLNADRSFVEDVCAAAVRLHETDARRVWEAVGGERSQRDF